MKARLTIAIGIGALISDDFSGHTIAKIRHQPMGIFGTSGHCRSVIGLGSAWGRQFRHLALALVWAVNAVVYGLVALAVVSVLKISN
jgi:hypothetical protein